MRKRRWLLTAVVLLLLAAMTAVLLLPRLLGALPGQVRARLPEELVRLVTTPLPTALPAPQGADLNQPVVIPTLPSATAVPTDPAIALPPPNSAAAETAVMPPTPTLIAPTALPSPTAPPPTALPLPAAARIEGLTVIPQKFNNCGPTNLTMTLNFFGHETEQLTVASVLKPNEEDRNVSPWEMAAYVQSHTALAADSYSGGSLPLLKQLIAAGYPVIVEKSLTPSAWQGWMGHYLTLFGYDDVTATFATMDTLLGPWDSSGRLESYETLAEQWHHFNNSFIVIYPPQEAETVAQIVGETLRAPTRMWQQAAQQAQTAVTANPGDPFAWFNLGSSLTALGELSGDLAFYENAALAFDQARTIGLPARMLWYQFQPYVAYLANGRYQDVLTLTEATLSAEGGQHVEETYFYRGQALLAMGDLQGAATQFTAALAANPNYTAAQTELANILNRS